MNHIVIILALSQFAASSPLLSKSYYLDRSNEPGSYKSRRYTRHRPQLIKRSPNLLNQETESFSISLSCDFQEFECQSILDHLVRVSKRIQNVVAIRNRIRINATYKPFCDKSDLTCNVYGTLGYASPESFHQFSSSANSSLPAGIDYDYVYPSALIRQLVPSDDPYLNRDDPDFTASFNSDINWWFSKETGMSHTEEFGPTAKNSSLKSYDFEQVALHEMLHGLGFTSGWNTWLGDGGFYPSFKETENGQFQGFAPSWIFDKHCSDAINGVWMRDYDAAIRQDILKSIDSNPQNWYGDFSKTTGYHIAKALGEKGSPFLTPRGLWSWFPTYENAQIVSRYAILFTPENFDSGSSISHMDHHYYSGTSQYIMRPSAIKYVGLDGHLPYNRLGPLSESVLGVLRAMGYSTAMK